MITDEHAIGVYAFVGISSIFLLKSRYEVHKKKRLIGSDSSNSQPLTNCGNSTYDVVIVGAGPAGSTSAYFLGKYGFRVALFDKKKFPRNKPCGDAWCAPALDILEEMGVLKKMEEDGIIKQVTRGGLISPFGFECINTDGTEYGSVTGCRTYAIKRRLADEYLVRQAASIQGVDLFEATEVKNAQFNEFSEVWNVETSQVNDLNTETNIDFASAKILLICDGSTSYLAKQLHIIDESSQPEAVCSHAYIKNKSHNWHSADGVMIFNRAMLPGYSALFRHYNDDVYIGTYVLPGGKATSRSITQFETEAMQQHPYIREAVGDAFVWEEKRVVAPIRLGGVKRSYAKQLLLVGDAAGHVDPLTGEGIHTAMIAAKIAAQVIHEMFLTSDFSLHASRAYELRCYDRFVKDFYSSSLLARIIVLLPEAVDALAVVGKRRGQSFLDFFGEVMTGVRPKSDFLRVDIIFELAVETCRQLWLQRVRGAVPLVPQRIGKEHIDKYYRK